MSDLQGGLYPKQSHLGEQPCGDSPGGVRKLKWCKYQGFGLPTAAAAGGHCHQPSQPRLARSFHDCSLTAPLEPQGWQNWNGCSQRVSWRVGLEWETEKERIKIYLRHEQKSAETRDELQSCCQGREETWPAVTGRGGRWYSPGLFLASGIQIFVEICLRTVTMPRTKWKEKEGQADLGGMKFPTWDK